MLNVKQITELLGCDVAFAKKIEATMAAMGFDFSACTQKQFNEMATACFEIVINEEAVCI